MALEQALGKAHATGDRLVEVDRGRLAVRRADLADESKVAWIDHEQDGGHGLDGSTCSEQSNVQVRAAPTLRRRAQFEPVGSRLELDLGQVDRAPTEVLIGPELELLEHADEARHHDLAVDPIAAGNRRLREPLQRLESHGSIGIGVVVRVHSAHVSLAFVPVQLVHMELRRLVKVDRVLVDESLSGEYVDLSYDSGTVAGRVDDHDVLFRGGTERHRRRREVVAGPVPAHVAGLADVALLSKEGQERLGIHRPEMFPRLEGKLEAGRLQMAEENVQVVRVEPGLLRGRGEQEVRMSHDIPINGPSAGDQDGYARLGAAARPSHLLPRGGDRAGIAGQDRDLELAHVDAELQCVGADHAQHLTISQTSFHRPSLRGQVPSSVTADARTRSVAQTQRLAKRGQHQLHAHSRTAEDDRLSARPQEGQRPSRSESLGRPSCPGRGIDQRRLHQKNVPFAGRGAVAIHKSGLPPGEGRSQLSRVPDRGRTAHDHRMRAVVSADTQQTAKNVGDVATEQAAVRVQLVYDDDLELFEELKPLRVVGQDRGMKHVGVGHNDLAGRSNGGTDGVRGIPVVGGRVDLQPGSPAEFAHLGYLVLTERLGGEEEEGSGGRILGQALQNGNEIAQCLARGGGRNDDDVFAGPDGLDGLGLVRVQAANAPAGQARLYARVQPGGHRHDVCRPGRHQGVMPDTARQRGFRQDQLQDPLDPGRFVVAHAEDLKPNGRAKCGTILAANARVCRG